MNRKIHNITMHKKEKGVVLLTSLVFMLVLLAMLRFTLTSARVEEQKAAIDWDIVSARESAQAALDFAEQYILDQGRLYCLNSLQLTQECTDNPAFYAGALFALPSADLAAITHAGIGPTINSVAEKGMYTGTFLATPPANGCRPFWACVNWPADAHSVRNSATQMNLAANASWPSIECITCVVGANMNRRPHFIIERLTAGEMAAIAPQFANASPNAVILRVTAVGFGRGAAGTQAAANTNMSNVMLQSTYILGG